MNLQKWHSSDYNTINTPYDLEIQCLFIFNIMSFGYIDFSVTENQQEGLHIKQSYTSSSQTYTEVSLLVLILLLITYTNSKENFRIFHLLPTSLTYTSSLEKNIKEYLTCKRAIIAERIFNGRNTILNQPNFVLLVSLVFKSSKW